MKKRVGGGRFKLIDVLLTTIIIFLAMTALLIIFADTKNGQNVKSAKSPGAISDKVKVDKADSNFEGIRIITETSNDPLAKFAIQYPQSDSPEFNEQVKSFITEAKNSYLKAMGELTKTDNKKRSELNISFDTHMDRKGNYSFVLKNNETLRGTKKPAEIETFHLNPKTGTVMEIETVFKNESPVVREVTNRVRKTLSSTEKLQEGLIADKAQIRTEPEWRNYKNFALTDKEIIFYFESGSLKDESAGTQAAKIPIEDMNDLLKPEFQVATASADKTDGTMGSKSPSDGKEQPEAGETAGGEDGTEPGNGAGEQPGQPQVKRVALTFDDGPDPKSTAQILEILKKYDAKATFFMLGSRVEYYPDMAKAVKAAGHEIGNHSWNHPDLSKMPLPKALEEINRTRDIILKVTGEKPTVFRPPYGAYTEQLSKQTIPPIKLWTVDTLDWKYRDAGKLLEEVKKSTHDGSTILMHDIHQSTADGLDSVMAYLKGEGYTFVTVSEMK
ncbi:hypothetical protein NCCP2716_21080 [Sporosarcina sp. NCCP-2716]|uniref:polysaccharide deacetylase family protein n=1 Tax=Sporosarcina sp. NCCP-2716 TaxID=2943679 RepID=UPI00203F1285|nr:polysaccharide deacetylase family protein [Sporosarcina sp. NCCP-2716]GKV69610.1 hypothetical protein NCCP2716_21080 [Sporosarcina sp. NCCP-2716]